MTTRKQVREQLATLFSGGSFNQVYAYSPSDLLSGNKILCIYSKSSRHDNITKDWDNNLYSFWLDVFVKRVNTEVDEDTLDDLHEEIRSVVRANAGTWDNVDFNTESDALFAEVSGIPYRVERHTLIIKVN